jgi:preprotein translocase subunit YajC
MNATLAAIALQARPPGSDFTFFVPMIAIFVIFYLLLIRPQQRRQKEHEKLLASIERGDSVVTTGGLHGKVTGVTDDVLTVEIAALKGERVRVKVSRSRIETVSKGTANGGEES